MADSDKADKKPVTRPTVKGAGSPAPKGSGSTGAGRTPAADETAVRPAVGAQRTAGAAAAKKAAPAGQARPPAGAPARPAPARPSPAKPAPAKAAPKAEPKESPAEQTLVSSAPVTQQVTVAEDERERSITSGRAPGSNRRPRRARLRLTRIDPMSVMKASFLLSVAFGVVTFVAVLITWSVLGAAGVWDSVNATVGTIVSSGENESTFDIRDYVGMGRVLGFTLIIAVVDVILLTAIATLTAFLYNMAASLLGGVEVTLSEDEH